MRLSTFVPTNKQNLSEYVTKQIVEAIQNGVFAPGERLPGEVELAQRLQISRNSIREALKTLCWSGVIITKHGLGTFVAEDVEQKIANFELIRLITKDPNLVELTEVRVIIESKLAFLATKRARESDLKELFSIIETQRISVERNIFEEIDLELNKMSPFHEKIAIIADNKVALNMLRATSREISLSRKRYYLVDDPEERYRRMLWNLNDHERIYQLITNNDATGAEKTMEKHLSSMLEQMVFE